MKKLIIPFIIFAFALIFPLTAKAEGDFVINTYNVDVQLHENNTATVSEQLNVYFNVESRGIIRYLPETVQVQKNTSQGLKTYKYNVKISDIKVEGAPFKTFTENGKIVIQIGDANTYFTGLADYKISFLYDMGDDRVTDFDEVFFTVIGPDWPATIGSLTFNFTFPKDFDRQNLVIYSGDYGMTENEFIDYTVEGLTVSGYNLVRLTEHQTVSLFCRLPEGYFIGARKTNVMLPAYLAMICGVIIFIMTMISFFGAKPGRRIVETIEFYPPDDISPAEVGYFIDGVADDKDIISLIFRYAKKGYLSIDATDEKRIVLNKIKDIPKEVCGVEGKFFKILFNGTNSRVLGEPDIKFADGFRGVKLMVESSFVKARELHDGGTFGMSTRFIFLLSLVAGFIAAVAEPKSELTATLILIPMVALPLFISAIWLKRSLNFWKFKQSFFEVIGAALLLLIGTVIGFIFITFAPTERIIDKILMVSVFSACVVGILFMVSLNRPSLFAAKLTGKLLGFKNFIAKAELAKLNMLVEENPDYFYDILPYAYVFNLTDKWAKNFETLAVQPQPPDWYVGSAMFSPVLFMNAMRIGMDTSVAQIVNSKSLSGGAGGVSFGGGGGFSGGGFGGGGGGSW